MDAQAWLWLIPSTYPVAWNGVLGLGSLFCVLFLFYFTIMREKFSLLILARVFYVLGFVCFACRPLNSGWVEWGVVNMIISGMLFAWLAATKWCERVHPLKELFQEWFHPRDPNAMARHPISRSGND